MFTLTLFKLLFRAALQTLPLFGMISLTSGIIYGVFFDKRPLLKTDDPYIIGAFFAMIQSIGSLIYFTSRYYSSRYVKPGLFYFIYILLYVLLLLYLELFIGGEGAGYGYLIITGILSTFPLALLYFRFYQKQAVLISGYISLAFFLAGFSIMALSR